MAFGFEKQNSQDSRGIARVADCNIVPDDPSWNPTYVLTRGGPDGKVDTITVTYLGVSFLKTLTYTGSNLTSISAWTRL